MALGGHVICGQCGGLSIKRAAHVGLPIVGHLTAGHASVGRAVVGYGVESVFLFSKELEIALYFIF
jgi:hypothetical protein